MITKTELIIFLALSFSAGILTTCTHNIHPSSGYPLENADQLLEKSDTLNAIRSLESHILEGNDDPKVYAKLGFLFRSLSTIRGRLKSQLILERGLKKFPDNVVILIELGKTYYKQTFYPDADRCFKRVIAIDSTMCEAIYLMGLNYLRKWLRNHSHRNELQKACSILERACRCNMDRSDWLLDLAFAQYALDKYAKCLKTCSFLNESSPLIAEPHFLMGTIYLNKQLLESAWKEFNTALRLASQSEHYLDISILLDENNRRDYANSNDRKRNEINRVFWINNDPDPTTEINERFMQHISRVFLADFYFSPHGKKLKGSKTDRGIAFIKFGWPSTRHFDLGRKLEGRSEIWVYTKPGIFVFAFMDEFLNDNFKIPVSADRMKYMLHTYPHFGSLSKNFIEIPGNLNCYSFKDNTFQSSTYFFLALNADSIKSFMATKETFPLTLRASIFDESWNESEALNDTLLISMDHYYGSHFLHTFGPLTLPFSSYYLAVSAENEELLIRTVYRRRFSTLEYMSDSLALSDILLFSAERDILDSTPIVRPPFKLYPSGTQWPSGSRKLGVYFEIYNLGLKGSLSNYSISYQIYRVKKRPKSFLGKLSRDVAKIVGWKTERNPTVTQTYERSGMNHNEKEKVKIDLSSAFVGDYILSIRVFDNITQQLSQRLAYFTLNE